MQPLDRPSRKVTCPGCGNVSEYNRDNPYRPFCSERCKLIDLGQWASENYRIANASKSDDSDEAA